MKNCKLTIKQEDLSKVKDALDIYFKALSLNGKRVDGNFITTYIFKAEENSIDLLYGLLKGKVWFKVETSDIDINGEKSLREGINIAFNRLSDIDKMFVKEIGGSFNYYEKISDLSTCTDALDTEDGKKTLSLLQTMLLSSASFTYKYMCRKYNESINLDSVYSLIVSSINEVEKHIVLYPDDSHILSIYKIVLEVTLAAFNKFKELLEEENK